MLAQHGGRPNNPRISIVIPAKNEARNLEIILPLLPRVHEVILVDGHSVDGTPDVARRVRPEIQIGPFFEYSRGSSTDSLGPSYDRQIYSIRLIAKR